MRGQPGWIAAMAYAVCCALRLARFNSRLGVVDLPPWPTTISPAFRLRPRRLVLLPMIRFEIGRNFSPSGGDRALDPADRRADGQHPATFSFKGPACRPMGGPALAGVGLLAAMLVSQPW
ncbi:hypothetical protein [Azospirillum sp. INR13]|uniref:hypothetical protein n=1 Tax=Azospirillum sp. INR13 TaxID=2596919 RepID=UPI002102B7C3|nr:hypothetical protein [Azospirillum sp. INR13]